MKIVRLLLLVVLLTSACAVRVPVQVHTPTVPPAPSPSPKVTPDAIPDTGEEGPAGIRAAFYYPWFPQAWKQRGMDPYTQYHPALGKYQSEDPSVIEKHIAAMQYGKIEVGIASWWGQQHHTNTRIPALLKAGEAANFSWALYLESEGQDNPPAEELLADLEYIRDNYATSPAYHKIDGKFLVFVYTDPEDGCDMVARWKEANLVGAYVVLKVFKGYRACEVQPDGWHQYAPAKYRDSQDEFSYNISPGFWKANEPEARLKRDLDQWQTSIRSMNASGAQFHLIATFNEWGEGTAIEDAQEWTSPSGYGYYLDALHYDGNIPADLYPFTTNLPTVVQSESMQVMIGAGDIGHCSGGPDQTAALLARHPGATIFTTGDNAYPKGSSNDFRRCFDPTWGQYKDRIRPAPGNHEYQTKDAVPYYEYFGESAGEPGKGYYSYDLGDWHIIVLNSNCGSVSGCKVGSPQDDWLRADLAAHPAQCTLAYWHHPRFSSGKHGSDERTAHFWQALYDAGVDLVLNGHEHSYERFAPQDPAGNLDVQKGIRQIIIGTGGAQFYDMGERLPNSEVVITDTYGLLKLNLESGGYQWTFLPVDGKTASDQGSDVCH